MLDAASLHCQNTLSHEEGLKACLQSSCPCRCPFPTAGQVTSKKLLADVAADEIEAAVGSNVLGSLLGSRAAVGLMRRQPKPTEGPEYHIFNLGFSSWGAAFSKTAGKTGQASRPAKALSCLQNLASCAQWRCVAHLTQAS